MTTKQTKSNYDRLSRWYDLFTGSSEKKITEMGLHMLGVQPGEKVLEIGFGTGNSILEIASKVGGHGKVCGIDISTGMLQIALKKIIKSNLSSIIDISIGNAMQLPYGNKTFDSVFISFTLELFDTPEIPVVLNECKRVMKNNGRICVVSMSDKAQGPAISLYRCAHRLFPRYIDCRPISLDRELLNSGFRIVESKLVKIWGLPIEIVLVKN